MNKFLNKIKEFFTDKRYSRKELKKIFPCPVDQWKGWDARHDARFWGSREKGKAFWNVLTADDDGKHSIVQMRYYPKTREFALVYDDGMIYTEEFTKDFSKVKRFYKKSLAYINFK